MEDSVRFVGPLAQTREPAQIYDHEYILIIAPSASAYTQSTVTTVVLGIGRDFNIDNWLLNIDQYID